MGEFARPSPWAFAFLFVVGLAWLYVNRQLFDDILSPFAILFFAWVGPLLLQTANLSGLETPWAFRSAGLVVWITIIMTAVSLAAYPALPAAPPDTRAQGSFKSVLALFRQPAFLFVFVLIYGLVFAVYVYAEFVSNPGGVPLVNLLQGHLLPVASIHRWGKDSRWTVVTALLYVLVPMAYFSFKANRGRPRVRALMLGLTLLVPVMGVLKLSRSDVFAALIAAFAVESYTRFFGGGRRRLRRRELLRLVAGGAFVLLVYYAMMGIRIGSAPFQDVYSDLIDFRVARDVPLRGFMGAVYGYTAMPFENLHRFLDIADGRLHPGAGTFRPFLSAAGLGDMADAIGAAVNYPAAASGAAGSATFLTSVVAESGFGGSALVVLLIALLMNVLYVRLRNDPSMLNLFLYINFLGSWFWLFFNNAFGVLSLYINAAFVVVVALVSQEVLMQRRSTIRVPDRGAVP